jgi:hypothetical protein
MCVRETERERDRERERERLGLYMYDHCLCDRTAPVHVDDEFDLLSQFPTAKSTRTDVITATRVDVVTAPAHDEQLSHSALEGLLPGVPTEDTAYVRVRAVGCVYAWTLRCASV